MGGEILPILIFKGETSMRSEHEIMKLYNQHEHLISTTIYRKFGNKSYRILHGLDKDDLMQYGRIGLYNACKSFDESKTPSFRNHAIRNIEWSIMNESKRDSLTSITQKTNDIADRISFDAEYATLDGEACTLYDIVESSENGFNEVEWELSMEALEETLSERVRDIVDMRMKGYNNVEIAEQMCISRQRVDTILKKNKDKIMEVLCS